MRRSLKLLDDIRIASPCPVAWDTMVGDDRVRHCGQCQKSVYDISALTADEAIQLLERSGETPCVRLYRRADGTVITSDCLAGRVRKIRRVSRRAVLAVASWLGFAVVTGCREEPKEPQRCQGIPKWIGEAEKHASAVETAPPPRSK